MHDPQAMGFGHGPRQDLDEPRGPLRHPGRAVESLVQATSGQVLQLEERQALDFADGIDLDDVPMLQLGDRLGLAQESGDGLGPGMSAGQDHLDGAGAIEADLPGLIDDAHAAAAQLTEDLIAGESRDGPPGFPFRGMTSGRPRLHIVGYTPGRLRSRIGPPVILACWTGFGRLGSGRISALG